MSPGRLPQLSLWALLVLLSALALQPQVSASPDSYAPTEYNLLGSTAFVSGELADLNSGDGVYVAFRSYATQTSAQTLYVHEETTTINGTDYRLSRLESPDTSGVTLSASMDTPGRKLWGKFVYPLTGVTAIPANTWTFYYRTWYSSMSENVTVTNSPSSLPFATWLNAENAFSSNDMYASTNTDMAIQQYGVYGFDIPPGAEVIKVEVGYEAYVQGNERLGITLSWNNGTSWAPQHTSLPLVTSDPDTVIWVDFTNATNWTAEKLSSVNLLTAATAVLVGVQMDQVYLDWIPVRVTYRVSVCADVDILIRKSNGEIRQTIATDVADSEPLSTTAQTLSGIYSWPGYVVVDETDHLEIDYYLNITSPKPGTTAFLRIDDNTSPTENQTRATNILLPNEYTVEVEFTGSSNPDDWAQLGWTFESAWTTSNISVALQLYNYTLGAYSTDGDGYGEYVSSSIPHTDETKSQSINTNPTNFRDASGNWKMKIKGVKSTTSQFEIKIDLVKYETIIGPPQPYDAAPILTYLLPISLVSLFFLIGGIIWRRKGLAGEGFEFFDEMTGGGIPETYATMIIGGANAGKSVFCQQLAHTYLNKEKPCLYVTYDSFPDEVRKTMKNFNWETSKQEEEGTFRFVDCYSAVAGVASKEEDSIKQPFSLINLGTKISAAMHKLKGESPKIFLDSTAPLFTRLEPSKVVEFLQDRSAKVKGSRGAFFFAVGDGIIPPDLMSKLEEVVDCIIQMYSRDVKGKTSRALRVKKLRGRRFVDFWIPFKITPKQGLVLFPPKDWSKSIGGK